MCDPLAMLAMVYRHTQALSCSDSNRAEVMQQSWNWDLWSYCQTHASPRHWACSATLLSLTQVPFSLANNILRLMKPPYSLDDNARSLVVFITRIRKGLVSSGQDLAVTKEATTALLACDCCNPSLPPPPPPPTPR